MPAKTADQIAREYGCEIVPGVNGPVLLTQRRNQGGDVNSELRDLQAARREMIALGVMPRGMIGGES